MLDVFGLFSVETLYVLIGIAVLLIISIVLSIVAIAKSSSMKKKYNMMMEGSEGKSIEQIIKAYTDDVKLLKETYTDNTDAIKDIYEKMQYTFHKIGIVKYDAFNEMGGKLSFALAMLDNNNTGWIINAMHSREGCYTYVKEIVKGESYVELAEEEAEALDKAIFEDGYEEEVNKAVASVTGSMKMAKSGPAKNGNQKNSNARSAKQASGKANNGKILNTRTSSMRPDMARPEKNRK